MFNWVDNTVKLYYVNKNVDPLKKKVADMTHKLEVLSADLIATE